MPKSIEEKRAAQRAWCKANPERRKEHKRAEYRRNRARYAEQSRERTKGLYYARQLAARAVGLPVDAVTDEMAEAKLAHIVALRAIRDALRPAVCDAYSRGLTTYEIAELFGIDRMAVSGILKSHNIRPKHKPACKWGHEYTADNTRVEQDGTRRCRKCAAERTRKSYFKRKEALKREG